MTTIWCLFEVENAYDQPRLRTFPYNLYAWWSEKPNLEQLSQVLFGKKLEHLTDENIIASVEIFRGAEIRIENTDFRLEEVKEGCHVKEIQE